jgi:hypothetical protein
VAAAAAALGAVCALDACSLLTDLSGLSGGGAAASDGATGDAGALDGAANDADALAADAPHDAPAAEAATDGATTSKYAAEVLADAPLTYLRLGEAAGSKLASDATGNGQSGTLGNGHTFGVPGAISGDGDTALHLDGVHSGIDLGSEPRFDFPGTHAYSFEVWAKIALIDDTYRHLFKKNATPMTGRESYGVFVQGVELGYERVVADIHVTAAIPATSFIGKWKHVVTTYDGAAVHLYVDGLEQDSSPDARPTIIAAAPLTAGCGELFDNSVISGDIDEIAVYDKALSPERILIHFQTGRGLR